jgi:hypothetical protein
MIITATAPIADIEGSRQGSISAPAGPIALANGLNVTGGLAIDDAPCCDLVIVTGGPGWAVQAPATSNIWSCSCVTPHRVGMYRRHDTGCERRAQ